MSTGLPRVTINTGNGNLNQTVQTIDGVVGLVITGATITGTTKVSTGRTYQIFSLTEAENLGILSDNTNAFAWKQISDFYRLAQTGAELWFMLTTPSTSMEHVSDANRDFAAKLLREAKGRVKQLAISRQSTGTVTATDGLDSDVHKAVIKAQDLAEQLAARNRPLRILLDGKDFTGTISDLKDYTTDNKNRVAILIGNNDGSKNASVGLFLGRKAASPVHYNPGRVKDGAVIDSEAFFTDGSNVEDLEPGWSAIHDKGYIFFRSFTGRAGYFFTHAITLTNPTDDFKKLPYGWVMDKIDVLTYQTYIDEILEVIPLAENEQIHPALVKHWESKIETVINQQMTANGEISGVSAYINPDQPILTNGRLQIDLDILPVGYAEYITINLGFTTTLNT